MDAISIAVGIFPQAWTWIGKAVSTLREPFKLKWNFKHWIIFAIERMVCCCVLHIKWSALLKSHMILLLLGAWGHESSYRRVIVSQFVQVFGWLTLAATYWHRQSNKWQVMIPPLLLALSCCWVASNHSFWCWH